MNEVSCMDCGAVPRLHETPYRENADYVVACDCESRDVDVSSGVGSSTLVEPITGKWSNIDNDTRIGSGDPKD